LWHLPFFFGPLALTGPDATFARATIALIEFSIGLTGLSIVMTWMLNNCGGSTLLAIASDIQSHCTTRRKACRARSFCRCSVQRERGRIRRVKYWGLTAN